MGVPIRSRFHQPGWGTVLWIGVVESVRVKGLSIRRISDGRSWKVLLVGAKPPDEDEALERADEPRLFPKESVVFVVPDDCGLAVGEEVELVEEALN